MSLPPVPPRPPYEQPSHIVSLVNQQHQRQNSLPPPIPPLPPDLRYSTQSPPHYDQPLAAPKPYRADPSLPANMAQSLEAVNYNPGFIVPNRGPSPLPPHHHQSYQSQRGPSPLPPPQPANWQPWNLNAPPASYPPQPYAQQQAPPYPQPPPSQFSPHVPSLEQGMHNLSFSPQQQPPPQPFHRSPSMSTYGPPPKAPTPPRVVSASAPSLTAPLPTIPTLLQALPTVQQPSHDPTLRIAWARDVVFLLDRDQHVQSNDIPVGPATISDPQLLQLAKIAIPVILELANLPRAPSPNGSSPVYIAEAVYWRATFEASGAFPDMVKHDPRSAFRDFEAAARAGYHAAWFRLGRDYENFNDQAHAKDCFERGVKYGVESCLYRMGMAHLMGQLGLAQNIDLALPLLHRAATLSSLTVPQPAYVYSLLLLGEFTHPSLPPLSPSTFTSPHFQPPLIPPTSSPHLEARKHLERSAYLHFPPAQYKLGHFYEFATPPFPFDALLSVQYYSLASQQGEVEADMALSKWFLCGSEGAGGFDKDETLAWTFADKAARKGLPSAMFAMGYYAEVGVGGPKDLDAAVKWYRRAADQGNDDAKERLNVLTGPSAQPLSRQEHDTITETKLVRKRTQAKQRSEARPSIDDGFGKPGGGGGGGGGGLQQLQLGGAQQQYAGGGMGGGMAGQAVIENIRRQSLDGYARPGGPPGPGYYHPPPPSQQQQATAGRMPPLVEHPSYNQQQQQQQQQHHHQHQASPPPQTQTQLPNPSPRIHQHSSAPGGGGGGGGNTTGVGPRPQQPGGRQQQFPGAQRYTLTDPGSGSGSGSGSPPPGGMGMGRPNTASPRPGPSRAPSGGNAFDDMPGGGARPNKAPGPTTFAEMGFQGAKAEDKECVIM